MHPHPTTFDIPYGYCHCGCGQKTSIAPSNETNYGYVKGRARRYIIGHNARIRANPTFAEKLWAKLICPDPDSCWIWTGCVTNLGYGKITTRGKTYFTHRISYELHNGPIPDDLFVLHKCDTPPCCNPSHLFLGTHLDNIADKVSKERQQRGERHAMAKLTEADVIEIRRLYSNGVRQCAIAANFNTSDKNIHRIVKYQTWKHVP